MSSKELASPRMKPTGPLHPPHEPASAGVLPGFLSWGWGGLLHESRSQGEKGLSRDSEGLQGAAGQKQRGRRGLLTRTTFSQRQVRGVHGEGRVRWGVVRAWERLCAQVERAKPLSFGKHWFSMQKHGFLRDEN